MTEKSSKSPRRRRRPGREVLNVTTPKKKRARIVKRPRRPFGAAWTDRWCRSLRRNAGREVARDTVQEMRRSDIVAMKARRRRRRRGEEEAGRKQSQQRTPKPTSRHSTTMGQRGRHAELPLASPSPPQRRPKGNFRLLLQSREAPYLGSKAGPLLHQSRLDDNVVFPRVFF